MPTRKHIPDSKIKDAQTIDIDTIDEHIHNPIHEHITNQSPLPLRFRVNYRPTPLKRPRLTRIGGKPVIYDASKKEKKDWLKLAMKYSPKNPLSGPLRMFLEFYFPRPKNHYRTGKYSGLLKPSAPHIHTNMPDVDNLSKFILDAMNEVFYDDDRQVVELNSHKEYCNDAKDSTGYTIVTILPYETKLDIFKELKSIEMAKSNKRTIIDMMHIPDSSDSISM